MNLLRYRLLSPVLGCLLSISLWAAEPSVTPATTEPQPSPSTPSASVTPSNSPTASAPIATTGDAIESAWLQSFPAERKRQIGSGADRSAVIVWPPQHRWRGELILLPSASNADRHHGPLLELTERLSRAGWRCWLLAREPTPRDGAPIGKAPALPASTLTALQELIGNEAAPTDVDPAQEGKLPRFLLAQADAAELAWAEATTGSGSFAGMVLLGAEQLSEQAPKQSVLELQIAEQARHVVAAAQARQLRWQTSPQYQQQTLLTSNKLPIAAWLGNAIDGWLRKIASQQQSVAVDDSLKRQMTAQPSANTAATKSPTP